MENLAPSNNRQENRLYAAASLEIAAMDADEIACALADALPRNADLRTEIVAVGMLATALISGAREDDRADLTEEFCAILRRSVAMELN